jgi:hypothetical protein
MTSTSGQDEGPGAARLLRVGLAGCLLLCAASASACGAAVDLRTAIELTDFSGGWYDAGIENGKNKLVPTVTFRVRTKTDHNLRALALNVMFKQEGEETNLDEVYLQRVELGETGETPPIVVRARYGYTGEAPQTRAQILEHSQFQDVQAVIFGKQSSANWIELGRYDIPRQLLTK